jgi:hypothetical protein
MGASAVTPSFTSVYAERQWDNNLAPMPHVNISDRTAWVNYRRVGSHYRSSQLKVEFGFTDRHDAEMAVDRDTLAFCE